MVQVIEDDMATNPQDVMVSCGPNEKQRLYAIIRHLQML